MKRGNREKLDKSIIAVLSEYAPIEALAEYMGAKEEGIETMNIKKIDPFDVKAAVKCGQLEAYAQIDIRGVLHIFLRDTQTGEIAEIGEMGKNEAE